MNHPTTGKVLPMSIQAGEPPGPEPRRCTRCRLEHTPVSLAEWIWQLRDTKPKPTPAQQTALIWLASRLDPVTGCGWTTNQQIAADAGISKVDTVTAAVTWAQDHFLLYRSRRGRHIIGGSVTQSQWMLTTTTQHPRKRGLVPAPQDPQKRGAVDGPSASPTTPPKTGPQHPQKRGSTDRPGKRDQVLGAGPLNPPLGTRRPPDPQAGGIRPDPPRPLRASSGTPPPQTGDVFPPDDRGVPEYQDHPLSSMPDRPHPSRTGTVTADPTDRPPEGAGPVKADPAGDRLDGDRVPRERARARKGRPRTKPKKESTPEGRARIAKAKAVLAARLAARTEEEREAEAAARVARFKGKASQ
jgi:hypothetical protein